MQNAKVKKTVHMKVVRNVIQDKLKTCDTDYSVMNMYSK